MTITLGNSVETPLLPDLTPHAELALFARALYREGYQESHFGHIVYRQPDGTFLATPYEIAWNEVSPGDIMRMDGDGRALEGRWSITPAITLHTVLHRMRDDLTVSVHHHPTYATIWAARRELPPAYDQTSAYLDPEDVAVMDEYGGAVAGVDAAEQNVTALGSRHTALLANHGVLVTASSVSAAWLRSRVIEWRCKQAWMVEAVGGGRPMETAAERQFTAFSSGRMEHGSPVAWAAAVRRELLDDPALLTRAGSWWEQA